MVQQNQKVMKFLIQSFFILTFSFSAFSQLPKGDRILAWQIDMAENNNYDSAYIYGANACMESVHLFYTWSGIEPSNAGFDQSYLSNGLAIANLYYPAAGMKIELQIAPTNTVAKEVPSDLMSIPFDSPVMINRFKTLLDTIFTYIPNLELSALNIGNESDNLWGTNQSKYIAYKTFLDSVRPYAKQLYFNLHNDDLKVGTTLTLHGMLDPAISAYCQTLNSNLDIVSTTYYPLNSDFTMENPSVVTNDFGDLVNAYPDTSRPIYFVECGYSSSTTCNSSEQLQAQFFSNVFSSWDTYYDNVKYLTIFKSTDWSQQTVNDFGVYYGISSPEFLEYLRTLGVRTWDNNGGNKEAYGTILCELEARNWCSVSCSTAGVSKVNNLKSVQIYPNPVRDILHIDQPLEYLNTELFDVYGRSVLQSSLKTIYLNDLSSGTYILKFMIPSGQFIEKRIIKL